MKNLSFATLLAASWCLASLGLSASACGVACTSNVVFSVTVDVVDGNGVAVPDAKLTFTVDGGPTQNCFGPWGGGPGTYTCGHEQVGHFVITASRGGMTGTGEVDVENGQCGPQQAMITIKIQ
jgi:hypothetical protein